MTLPSWRFEYRAKLAELSYVDVTRDHVIDSFSSNQADDPAEPHSYANRKVMTMLKDRLGLASEQALHTVALDRLHAASKAALIADSRTLAQADPQSSP